jgi:tRNA A-37 threonylcarbamoyl transferase component Bud32/tetratricopeptide (TPR) repeat protein
LSPPIGGRYQLLAELGRGGMAIVYRVQDTKTNAMLALKRGVARSDKSRVKRRALLAREYHTLSQLAHPRIIEVYDFGVDDDGPYYVMELLEGSDLNTKEKLPFREACALLCDVASSLAILHARGLIHRDVSTRNVRRTADGRAKLIDFGTMMSMGVALEVVGTPPFMAPEVLQQQTLDARADLFSLGALGYRLLTGRHAYPVRRIRDLRDAWRTRPHPPSRFAPDMPAALSELVMQLLSFDRNARPSDAAEVIGRLRAIAGLPVEDNVAVANAYLTTPVLVGRESALIAVRKGAMALGRGDGAALLIEGHSGSGRSRLLDACAIEAKVLGAAVARIDAAELEASDFSVMRALLGQLAEQLPKELARASQLSRAPLAAPFEDVLGDGQRVPSASPPDRITLVRELRELVLTLSRKHRVLLAVDNFDRCDSASTAVLAALACKTERHGLIVALVVDRETAWATSPVQRLLRSVCRSIALDDLSAEQSEALLRSLFGDVGNLSLLAGRIHALAQGNPRATMELAQHLLNKGLVRHEAGAFSLPDAIDERDMPPTLASSLRQRLEVLSSDARELCHVVHATESDALGLADYARLTSHGEEKRVFAALDELVAARVLAVEADRCRFSQRGFAAVIAGSMPSDAQARLHSKVARLLAARGGEVLRRAHHLLESGAAEVEAVELLAGIDVTAARAPLPLLKRAVACADRLAHPSRHNLRLALLIETQALPDVACFMAHVRPFIAQLERDSGLVDYRVLEREPEPERMAKAMAVANERYLATPERERGYAVDEALSHLARLSGMFNSVGTWTLDIDTWNTLPSLAPFEPFSPAIAVMNRFSDATKVFVQGKFMRSSAAHLEVLARVLQPDHAGLAPDMHYGMQLGLHLLLGLRNAGLGLEVAEEHARELERDRMLRVSAWRIRQVLHSSRGDLEEARRCMRRAELLQLQIGGEQYAASATFAVELPLAAMIGDIAALKTLTERVSSIAERLPGWQPLALLGESRLRSLQGDPEGALALLLPAFELALPGRHWCFILLCEAHVATLNSLGRFEEAIAVARNYKDVLKRADISLIFYGGHFTLQLAHALSKMGQHEEAIRRTETVIANIEGIGAMGFISGAAYETRARIALAVGDIEAFDRYAERCAREYGRFKNPVLLARLARLFAEARALTGGSFKSAPLFDELSTEATTNGVFVTVSSRMRECHDLEDRARCALTIILQHVESFAGYLYGLSKDGVTLLAGLPDAAPDVDLEPWLQRWTEAELASFGREPVTQKGGGGRRGSRPPNSFADRQGRVFEPLLMCGHFGEDEHAAAVMLIHVPANDRRACDRDLLTCLATELLERGDVSGVLLDHLPTDTQS